MPPRPNTPAVAAVDVDHLCDQERRQESTQAEEEMQPIHEWTDFFTMRPDQQGVRAGIDEAVSESLADHNDQQATRTRARAE